MKIKPYRAIGIFVMAFAVIGAAAYYFYPDTIKNIVSGADGTNNLTEIDAGSFSDATSADGVAFNDASPTSPASFSDTADSNDSADEGNDPSAAPSAISNPSSADQNTFSSEAPTDDSNDTAAADASQADTSSAENNLAESAASSSAPLSSCSFPAVAPSTTTQEIMLNEIAWMGSPSSSNAEWMEIKNNSANDVDLSGWELLNASGKIKILFSEGDAISAGGFFLLSRTSASAAATGRVDAAATASSEKIYSGDLVNSGDVLALVDPQCDVSDYLDASHGWPGGNNSTKQTLERDAGGGGWHTSALPGGTPGAENSAGPPPAQYTLTVAFSGSGPDSIVSDPANLACTASCTGSYASGTQITLTPVPGKNSVFSGWSGLCYGQTDCSFVITGNTSITADFQSTLVLSNADDPSLTPTAEDPSTPISTGGTDVPTSTMPGPAPGASGTMLISAVQIGGASSSNDLVRLYNPTDGAIDMSGWRLHKKSSTGADYSLKEFPTGSVVGAGQSFTWANADGGFSETVGANVSSTETLSADNSVALMDASGNVIDAVAWGTGTGQYGEGAPYPTDPGSGQTLVRQSSNGVLVNTNNNASDFSLQ